MRTTGAFLVAALAGTIAARGSERSDRLASLVDAARQEGGASVDDCFRMALLANESIGQAMERQRQSEARRRAGRAALLPSVSAQGTGFQQDPVAISGEGGSVVPTSDARQELRLHVDQPITKFGAEGAGLRELAEREEADRRATADESRRLYGVVARAYVTVLLSEGAVKVRQESVRAGEERLDEMEARASVGLARAAEVLAVKAQLSSDRAALEEANGQQSLAREDLVVLVGLPRDVPLAPIDAGAAERAWPMPGPEALDPAAVLESIESRPDIGALRSLAGASQDHVALVRGGILPALSLGANYYAYRNGYSQFQQDTGWDATLTLSIPLFDGGATRARVAEARSLVRAAELRLDGARREALRDVRAAELTLRSGEARLTNLADALAQAEESAALSAEEYRQGLGTNLEVESARTVLREARLAHEAQRLQIVLARIDLLLALHRVPITEEEALP